MEIAVLAVAVAVISVAIGLYTFQRSQVEVTIPTPLPTSKPTASPECFLQIRGEIHGLVCDGIQTVHPTPTVIP